jgi:hypothetical protein
MPEDIIYSDKLKELAIGEHDDTTTPTKKVLAYGWDLANLQKARLRVDSDGHLQVDVLSGGGAGEQYADGTAVNAAYKGNLILGTDGTNYQILKVDTNGELQIDVLTLPSLPAGTNLIGGVNLAQLGGTALSGANIVDTVNSALKVNVVAGGAGGGVAQTQVRSSANAWTDVGYYTGNLNMPVEVKTALPAGTNNIGDVDVLSLPSTVIAGMTSLPAGTNNIGDVDVLSLPSTVIAGMTSLPAGTNNIGDVDVLTLPAIPAGTNLIGKVSSGGDTSTIYDGTTALTPKFAPIAAATLGDNTLVAAVTGKKIKVLAISAVVSAATNVYFTSGAAGTVIFGGSTNKINLAANSGLVLGFNPVGWFETAAGAALVVNLSAANSFSGGLVYVEV